MSECTHNCSTCGESCDDRDPRSFMEPSHRLSQIKKVVAVVSGKGGVGKSSVTSMLAVLARRKGLEVGILDADITGPSIPTAFGVTRRAEGDEEGIYPVLTRSGIKIMSLNLLIDDPSKPVIWRGPVIAGAVKQFWTDVIWGDIDCLFVDMPPGTGDVPLTVFQSLPVDGIVVVTSPQELVSAIVDKAVNMAEIMNIPILGVVENYSYYKCPDCGSEHSIFGPSHLDETAEAAGVTARTRLPIDPNFARLCDEGRVEDCDPTAVEVIFNAIPHKDR